MQIKFVAEDREALQVSFAVLRGVNVRRAVDSQAAVLPADADVTDFNGLLKRHCGSLHREQQQKRRQCKKFFHENCTSELKSRPSQR